MSWRRRAHVLAKAANDLGTHATAQRQVIHVVADLASVEGAKGVLQALVAVAVRQVGVLVNNAGAVDATPVHSLDDIQNRWIWGSGRTS